MERMIGGTSAVPMNNSLMNRSIMCTGRLDELVRRLTTKLEVIRGAVPTVNAMKADLLASSNKNADITSFTTHMGRLEDKVNQLENLVQEIDDIV